MDRILIILKKKEENGPRASSAPALGLNTIIFKHVYWYMQQISGERLQDHWSSCSFFYSVLCPFQDYFSSISRWAKTGEPREKIPDTPASRTWLVSHMASMGLEPTPDTALNYFIQENT